MWDDIIYRRTPQQQTFAEAVEKMLARLKSGSFGLLQGGMVAGAIGLAALTGVAGCEGEDGTNEPVFTTPNVPVPGVDSSKTDWAQYEGSRNTDMVAFNGEFWNEAKACYDRFCGAADVILKLYVQPVEGADHHRKRVGIVLRRPGFDEQRTFTGDYFATNGGKEEWHVRVGSSYAWSDYFPLFAFTAWYQDGKGNTYYDDNHGEFHAVCSGERYRALSQVWCCQDLITDVKLDSNGVSGSIRALVADLDYDKEVVLRWTTDDWATFDDYTMGNEADVNAWHYVRPGYGGAELWEINLSIPGDFEKFEYAILYRHGVKGEARRYEFWDNNGGRNFVVTRADPADSPTQPDEQP